MPEHPAEPASLSIGAGRLSAAQLAANFADDAPLFTRTQALVEAERCLYCHDAPCATACPTGIDVPSFIRRISEDNLRGAARAILSANPLGGTCARVCPTEVLCEQVCVRTTQSGKPVEIGRLQRYAVDAVMGQPVGRLIARAAATGRRVAVVGAGPAGLACAFELARLGHEVVVHDAHAKAGGLNEYGLAAYKTAGGFAQRELDWLLGIGGISVQTGWKLEQPTQLQALREAFDAVYLALGLGRTPMLGLPGESLAGVRDAIDFIAELLQAPDKAAVPIGRRVVVVGGGMTAVDAAVQAKLLGAEQVHMVYRRGPATMGASSVEQERALTHGVVLHHWLAPAELKGEGGQLSSVRFASTQGGAPLELAADMLLKAIGQKFEAPWMAGSGVEQQGGRIVAADDGKTAVPGLWAGGDCRLGGRDLTVEAVEDGKRAAHSIHAALTGGK